MNKKPLLIAFAVLMVLSVGTASLLAYFETITATVTVSQSVVFAEGCDGIDAFSVYGGESVCEPCAVENRSSVDIPVSLANSCLPTTSTNCDGVTTAYFKDAVAYSYTANIADVGVEVEDTGDGWLEWTYTYADTPTHTPKMTVAIDYPNGFAITTFDDGSHTGWYNAVDGETEVQLTGSETWVETTGTANTLTVKIQKSVLDDTFHWHGYANYNGLGVWINADETGSGYGDPAFNVTLREATTGFTVPAGEEIAFNSCYSFAPNIEADTYVVTTEIDFDE